MESHDKLTVLKKIKQAALGCVSRREKKKKSWVYERCWHLEQARKRDKCHILWNNYRVNPRFKATSSLSFIVCTVELLLQHLTAVGSLYFLGDSALCSKIHKLSIIFHLSCWSPMVLFVSASVHKTNVSFCLGYCLESLHRPLKLGSLSADCPVPLWLHLRC